MASLYIFNKHQCFPQKSDIIFSISVTNYPALRVAEVAGAYPSCLGLRTAGWHPGQVNHVLQGHKEKNNHLHWHFRQFMSGDSGRRPECPERTCAHTQTACKFHIERAREPNLQPSYCEATVLTMHRIVTTYSFIWPCLILSIRNTNLCLQM